MKSEVRKKMIGRKDNWTTSRFIKPRFTNFVI